MLGGFLPIFKKHIKRLEKNTDLDTLTEEGIYIAPDASQFQHAPSDINKKAMAIIIVVDFPTEIGVAKQFAQTIICGNTMFNREKVQSFSEWLKVGA